MLEDLQGAQGAGEDTFTEIGEESWYNPELDLPAINAYLESWSGPRSLHVVEMFGLSRRIQKCWGRRGFAGVSLDIKLGGVSEDILSKDGWYTYLDRAMSLRLGYFKAF
ncbi:unnamed protein product [Symbiodinium pilosum]|uniref:Uncharacterized protein n=1 Tax=Symbiodinium pilosum TaxID=2952 RepID=A0A812WNZ9_SYMPI|nr:unnamed protein product [Symbiodinium pilosum]